MQDMKAGTPGKVEQENRQHAKPLNRMALEQKWQAGATHDRMLHKYTYFLLNIV